MTITPYANLLAKVRSYHWVWPRQRTWNYLTMAGAAREISELTVNVYASADHTTAFGICAGCGTPHHGQRDMILNAANRHAQVCWSIPRTHATSSK